MVNTEKEIQKAFEKLLDKYEFLFHKEKVTAVGFWKLTSS